jgi:predicted nucleic acid-binding protein
MTRLVVLDTNVLVPIVLTDTMLRLAGEGFFDLVWSRRILDELLSALTRIYPDKEADSFQRRIEHMQRAFPHATARYNDDELSVECELPDPDDCHVLTLAQLSGAHEIITFNARDFPETVTLKYGISVHHPDAFLHDAYFTHPALVGQVLAEQIRSTRLPSLGLNELLGLLEPVVPDFVTAVRAGRGS